MTLSYAYELYDRDGIVTYVKNGIVFLEREEKYSNGK